jgi:hypothetical protein
MEITIRQAAEPDMVKLADYLGKVVILVPLRSSTMTTSASDNSEVTHCDAWLWAHDSLAHLGEIPVFQGRVRAQLRPLVGTGEAIIGTLVRNAKDKGQPYELEEVPQTVLTNVVDAFAEIF